MLMLHVGQLLTRPIERSAKGLLFWRGLLRRRGSSVELHGPFRLVLCVNLYKSSSIQAAHRTSIASLDRERSLACAKKSLTRPFAVKFGRVYVIVSACKRASYEALAFAWIKIPPALCGPVAFAFIADREPEVVAGVVAYPEIGGGRVRSNDGNRRQQSYPDGQSNAGRRKF